MQDNLYEICRFKTAFPPQDLEEKLVDITNDGFEWYHEIWGRIFITIPPERKIWFILKYGSIVLCK